MKLNECTKILFEKNVFTLKFTNKLRDVTFGKCFGLLQEAIRAARWDEKYFNTFVLDLTRCTWSDPIPLLSILVEFVFQKDRLTFALRLPSERSPTTNQFLKFLAQEGFLNQFIKHCNEVTIDGRMLKTEEIDSFKRLSVDLCYINSSFIPATLLNANDRASIIKWIDSELSYAQSIAIDKAPAWAHDDLLYRLKTFLRETLINVLLHAYPDNEDKYVGVYVRYREGLMGDLNLEQKKILKNAINEESNFEIACPRLPKDFLEERAGGIEIFVVDSGIGLCNSLLGADLKSDHRKRRLQKSWNDVFVKGKRKPNRKRNLTKYGGLHLLGTLLKFNKDYLRAYDDDEWCGSYFPMHRQHTAINTPAFGIDTFHRSVNGLCWTYRLSWLTPTDTSEKGFYRLKQYPGNYEEMLAKTPPLTTQQLSKIYIDDRRYSFKYTFDRDRLSAIVDCVLYMYCPTRNQTKNDILNTIREIGKNAKGKRAKTLIICDIPNHEAITYYSALNDFKATHRVGSWMLSFERIILVSRRLSGCVFIVEKRNFDFILKYSKTVTSQLTKLRTNLSITNHPSLLTIYQLLKYNDSFIFWTRILENHNKDRTYIIGDIEWGEGATIKDYLDFNQTLSDPICRKIYENALARVSGFFRESKISFRNIDYLTKSIAEKYNSSEPVIRVEKEKNVLLGSVYVTGITEKKVTKSMGRDVVFHIFKHPSSNGETNSLLFWIYDVFDESKQESSTQLSLFDWRMKFNIDKGYKRVGKSPIIAKGGHYYFVLPRWENEECAYGRSPRDSYLDWQNAHPTIAKIGHWKYGVNHDFVGINLSLEIKNSFQIAGDLSKFLIFKLYQSLANTKSKFLTDIGKYILGVSDECHIEKKGSDIGLVVYPSHPLADLSIELIKKCFTEDIHDRIISVRSIVENRVGSALLLPPLTLERIKRALQKQKQEGRSEVLFYDTTCISGETRKAFKHTLFSLGASEVRTLTLLDRRRLPLKVPDTQKHLSYWRLDVPRLGNKNTCPICEALKALQGFQDHLVTDERKRTIDFWINMWKETSPLSNWKEKGLSHLSVELEDSLKKFGIQSRSNSDLNEQIGGDAEKVRIEKTIGLTLYVSEIHAMTGRSDLALKYCKNEEKLNNSAIIELMASQLLLFGNEFEDDAKLDMLIELFIASNSYDLSFESNPYTALAAMTIFAQEKPILDLLFHNFDQNKIIETVNINEDMIIVLAYLLFQNPLKERVRYERVRRLLTSGYKISEIYNNLSLELYSIKGLSHTKPLCKFSDDSVDLKIRLYSAIDSLYQIKHLIEKLSPDYPRELRPIKSYENYRNLLIGNIQSICNELESLHEVGYSEKYNKIQNQITELIGELKLFHSRFFFELGVKKINNSEDRPFEKNAVGNIIQTLNQEDWRAIAKEKKIAYRWQDNPVIKNTISGEMFPDNKSTEAWVVWDRKIEEIIRDLIFNVIHSKEAITDPWEYESGIADMWVYIEYKKDYLTVNIANSTSENTAKIKLKTHRKNRWGHLKELGCCVNYKKSNNILFTTLKLPYAGKIKSSS